MQLMDQALLALVRAEEIDPTQAYLIARNKAEFRPYVREASELDPLMEA